MALFTDFVCLFMIIPEQRELVKENSDIFERIWPWGEWMVNVWYAISRAHVQYSIRAQREGEGGGTKDIFCCASQGKRFKWRRCNRLNEGARRRSQ